MAAAMDKLTTVFSRRSSIISTEENLTPTKPVKPGHRARSLTLPLEKPQKVGLRRVKQQTFAQGDSILFSLPLELREQIYRDVLAGRCIAQDVGGNRIGDRSDPWPPYERPGGERRGLRPWGWQPTRQSNFLSLLMTCRQIYSESINILYANNLFYFRNPLTNWNLSSWRILPQRLEQIRILILDETIADPSVVFSSRKQWNRMWRTIAKMSQLKVLYLNVDTLYARVWTAEFEKRLLDPLAAITQANEICVILKWMKPAGSEESLYPSTVTQQIWRQNDYDHPNSFYAACKPADMRAWIIKMLTMLEDGAVVARRDSLLTIT